MKVWPIGGRDQYDDWEDWAIHSSDFEVHGQLGVRILIC